VLLLVAPIEHKVRIEVGYGLEGTLTDALCSAGSKAGAVRRRGASCPIHMRTGENPIAAMMLHPRE
jgi:hypothetical protein